MTAINPIPALDDNYIWIIEREQKAIIVDPSEAQPVIEWLQQQHFIPQAILLTHNHSDHTAGVAQLLMKYPQLVVYAPTEVADNPYFYVKAGEHFQLLGFEIEVIASGGHTAGHISYLLDNHYLFCGDALFSAGCGRVFTGDYQAQFTTLQRFNQLPNDVVVFPAHEYTVSNLQFAHRIVPTNCTVLEQLEWAERQRQQHLPTLPTTIGREKQINLFLQAQSLAEFIALRQKKDRL